MSLARAYFRSLDSIGKGRLWVTDGTAAGTTQVNTINGGSSGLYPGPFATLGSNVFFGGTDNAGQLSLFKLDTANNAVSELAVSGVGPSFGLAPQGIVTLNGKLYFGGYDTSGFLGLWSSDGTASGTSELSISGLSGGSYYPTGTTVWGKSLVFGASPNTVSTGLWISDGSGAGTAKLAVNGASFIGIDPHSFASLGSKFVFAGASPGGSFGIANQLWVSDGTTAGTTLLNVPGLNPTGDPGKRPAGAISFGTGKAAFTTADASGKIGIWVTDGTVAGTIELPGIYGNSYGAPMAPMSGSRISFIASDANGIASVYVSDGTAAGTVKITVPGAAAAFAPHALITLGNQILFDGQPASGARALYASDGTSAGTSLVKSGINLVAGNIDTDAGVVGGSVAYTDAVTNTSGSALADIYTGPVSYLQQQYIWSGSHGVALRADGPSTFLKGGAGGDALQVTGGNNVLDGGGGSNFLVGATGTGADTFFVDERGSVETWSTIVNFHAGDQATIFGFHPGISTRPYTANDGAVGYTGLTIHSEINGAGTGILGSMTFTGIDQATADAHWSITTGTLSPGTASATDYLLIQWDH